MSRNFVINALPFIMTPPDDLVDYLRLSYRQRMLMMKNTPADVIDRPQAFLLAILSTTTAFMSGSLTPELVTNFVLQLVDNNFLNILARFSETLQFSVALRIRFPEFHVLYPYLRFDKNETKKSKVQVIHHFARFDRSLSKVISTSRYFIRQLVRFEFRSLDSSMCHQVFTTCLPKLAALRHLNFRFPVQHCIDDHSYYYTESKHMSADEFEYLQNPVDEDEFNQWFYIKDCTEKGISLENCDDYDADSILHHKCDMRIPGCISHVPTCDIQPTSEEFIEGLQNLKGLETLEIVSTSSIFSDQPQVLYELFSLNPLPYLRKLSLTIFPLSHASPKKMMSEVEYETQFDFGAISCHLPHLQSLTLRKMPVEDAHGDTLPNLCRMNELKELTLFGVIDAQCFRELMWKPSNGVGVLLDENGEAMCGHSLVSLSLGGYTTMETTPNEDLLDEFFETLSSTELRNIDLAYLRVQDVECDMLNNGLIEIWTRKFPFMESLDLSLGISITDETLRLVGTRLCHLKHLELDTNRDTEFTDEGLSHLFDAAKSTKHDGVLTSLESLKFGGENVRGEGWFGNSAPPPKQYYSLKRLHFENTSVTTEGLIQILFAFSECLEHFWFDHFAREMTVGWGRNRRNIVLPLKSEIERDDDRVLTRMQKLRESCGKCYSSEERPTIADILVDVRRARKE